MTAPLSLAEYESAVADVFKNSIAWCVVEGLAKATGLPFEPPGPPVAHGSLKVTLWKTGPLP